jgi:hypothetical protein
VRSFKTIAMDSRDAFIELERELCLAMEEDRRRARENEVKLRAIKQVSNYDEFR